jgi:hypothetical protein
MLVDALGVEDQLPWSYEPKACTLSWKLSIVRCTSRPTYPHAASDAISLAMLDITNE